MNGQKPDKSGSNTLISGDKYDTLRYTRDDLKQAVAESQAAAKEEADDPVKTRSVEQTTDPVSVCRWGTILPNEQKNVLFRIEGRSEPISIILQQAALTLGRPNPRTGELPDIDLAIYGGSEFGISRKHARLFIEDGMLKIRDLNSTNGTYLNGTRLAPYQSRILRNEDELRLGKLVLNVMLP